MPATSAGMTKAPHLALVTRPIPRQSYKRRQEGASARWLMGKVDMFVNRRKFVTLAAATLASPAALAATRPIKAIAFDGFPIIDPRPVFATLEEMFPDHGKELGNLWRTRQFEYTWLRTLGGRYADFWQVSEESLVFAAKARGIILSASDRDRLMQGWLALKAWPDVAPALQQLKNAGISIAFLSNLTETMLDAAVKNSGLEGYFESHLSTDRVKAFKPASAAYQMGIDAF